MAEAPGCRHDHNIGRLAVFEQFTAASIKVEDTDIFVRHAGRGPALLLLHGFPQTHVMWRDVAPALTADFSVVCADLRGYGASGKPFSAPDHAPYTKRAMARDMVQVMKIMGFERFDVAGHDRGGRVGYRLALDHPAAVRRLSILDIIPTGEVWARADKRFALGYWHWSFLAQPHPFPETLIGPDPEYFLFRAQFGGAVTGFDPEAYADYLKAAKSPSV